MRISLVLNCAFVPHKTFTAQAQLLNAHGDRCTHTKGKETI